METKKLPVGIENFEQLRKEDFYYAHHYGVVNFELVWETATGDIPGLADFCRNCLAE